MARDHLANERTFLSWVRTALGFVGFGLLVAELVDTEGVQAEVLGLCLILLGAVIAVSSTARFLRVAERLDKNEYQASTISPVVVGVSTVIVAIVGLIFAIT
jgi:putative membrane protein